MLEKELEIYDVWKAPNGNLFVKMTDDYSIAIGAKGDHGPTETWGELTRSQYVKSNNITKVKKVGKIVFD